ncbi:MAG: AAA family ATPase [Spirochaetales bacterium]|nr:AAA family ATPase [Spirochaetales bacterium]
MAPKKLLLPASELSYGIRSEAVERLDGGAWGEEIIGQGRAMEALRMGIEIRARGYNVFVTGTPGTGRRTAALRAIRGYQPARLQLRDTAFAFNFQRAHEPVALSFPAGGARLFKEDLHRFIENVKKLVRLQLESDEFKTRQAALASAWDAEENERLAAFEAELASEGFRVLQVEDETGTSSADLVAVVDGEPVGFEELQTRVASGAMKPEAFDALRSRYYDRMDRMKRLFTELRRGRVDLEEKLEKLRDETLRPHVMAEAAFLRDRSGGAAVHAWIDGLSADVLKHIYLFRHEDEGEKKGKGSPLARYGLNIVVDNGNAKRPPLVFETHPTWANLFGSIEGAEAGDRTAYLRIRAGALLKAAGGFLVLRAEDVAADEEVWNRLKRVLQTQTLEIQGREGPFVQGGPQAKPEAAPCDAKVVMIGADPLYDLLYERDPDFGKLFKVVAELDDTMPADDAALRQYVAFVRKIAAEEELPAFGKGAVAAVIERAVQLSGRKDRLSTRFSAIADLVREAGWRARRAGRSEVDADSVELAVAGRDRMGSMPEEKFADAAAAGEIVIDIAGSAVGRVNGLAVRDRGFYAFGTPVVISAQVSPGETGVLNIEGESGLSGEIYDKAVLIVEGFLRSRYARDFPLLVTAGVCFEQSYGGVEGDSASCAAVLALLSSISGVPLRQDIAVTGSLNQWGMTQAVGGVAEKVEGWFRVCRRSGFTGKQGVLIPRTNVVNLVLSRELREAAEAGEFSIWTAGDIDEAIEVMSGMAPGAPDGRGQFPQDSFNGRVRRELLAMAKAAKEYL